MRPILKYAFSLLGLAAAALPARARSDLPTPQQRREVLDRAAALTQPRSPAPLPPNIKNPFVPAQDAPVKKAAIVGDREVLAAIGNQIIPSGVMQAPDGELFLLLREKKLKVGDYLTITFEGRDYMIELTAIDHSSFTLRLNKEEITRPLNP